MILFLYLLGITIGGLLFTVLDRRGADPALVFVAALGLLVADLAVTIPLMDRVLYLQLVTLDAVGVGFWPFQLASIAAAGLVVFPPTILFGISFPAIAKCISPTAERVGTGLGLAYLVNTAGTTAGALAASFVLLPHLGLRASLCLLTGTAALAAALAAGRAAWASPARLAAAAAVVALALLPALAPAWDTRLMHTAISKDADSLVAAWREHAMARDLAGMTVLEVRDGVDATASVLEYGGSARVLFVNGKPDASNGVDMLTQEMIGHLPLLAHPQARQVLVIGMGSGVTIGAVARHPVESIEVVEISPEVLDLGARWFAAENHDVVHDPRLVVHLEDGRNFVAFNEDRLWDVIVSEPSNPWMTGASSLFTDEFFAQALRRLRPDGILAQWFHVYSMAIEDVRVLLATVHRHFDHVYVFTLFEVDQRGDMVVLPSNRALDFTPVLAALRGHGPAGDDLRELRFDATRLLQSFVLAPENLDAFVRGAAVNSDDRPVIELDAPRSVFLDTVPANLEALHRASGGARLPLAGADELAAGFRIAPPSGFRRSFSGFRNRLVPAAAPDARPLRGIATDVEFEDDGGRRLEVLGERGERDAGALATMAARGPATIVGDATVDDHPAAVYALPDGAITVAWTCDDSGFSYAATLRGAADRDAAVALLTTGACAATPGTSPRGDDGSYSSGAAGAAHVGHSGRSTRSRAAIRLTRGVVRRPGDVCAAAAGPPPDHRAPSRSASRATSSSSSRCIPTGPRAPQPTHGRTASPRRGNRGATPAPSPQGSVGG